MSHDDVYVMCQPNLSDVSVTWHDAVVSDIIFQTNWHVSHYHASLGSSCTHAHVPMYEQLLIVRTMLRYCNLRNVHIVRTMLIYFENYLCTYNVGL